MAWPQSNRKYFTDFFTRDFFRKWLAKRFTNKHCWRVHKYNWNNLSMSFRSIQFKSFFAMFWLLFFKYLFRKYVKVFLVRNWTFLICINTCQYWVALLSNCLIYQTSCSQFSCKFSIIGFVLNYIVFTTYCCTVSRLS